jgi:hypothetical protein
MRAIERLTGQAIERILLQGFGGAKPAATTAGGMLKPFAGVKRAGSSVGRRSFRPRRSR